MREIKLRAWHLKEHKMYFRAYQKISHILLCEDDHGSHEGKGTAVKTAGYDDCEMLESTGLEDKKGKEIFEGDILRVTRKGKTFQGILEGVPDMFRSRGLHPLHELLVKFGIEDKEENLEIEVLGNRYENPELFLQH